MKDKELDDLFAEKLKDFQVQPPDGMWNKIASELPQLQQGKKKLVMMWRYYAAAAAIMMFFGAGTYLYLIKDPFTKEMVTQDRKIANLPEMSTPAGPANINENEISAKTVEMADRTTYPTRNSENTNSTRYQPERINDTKNERRPPKEKQSTNSYKLTPLQAMETKVHLVSLDKRSAELKHPGLQDVQLEIDSRKNSNSSTESDNLQLATRIEKQKQSIITRVLNGIADNISIGQNDLSFGHDEEGSLIVDLNRSFVQKKR